MEFIFARIIGFLSASEPHQFQLVGGVAIFKIGDGETAVLGIDPPVFLRIESVSVELEVLLKVEHVEVVMNHSGFHLIEPLNQTTNNIALGGI